MANLLPPDALKVVRRTLAARLLFTFGLVASAVAIVAFAALIPSYLAVALGPHADTPPSGTATTTSNTTIIETQNLLAILQPLSTSTATSIDVLTAALSVRPQNVHIDHIDYSRSGSLGTIVLGGTATKASDLEAFRSALAKDGHFRQVTVPVSALAGVTDGRFAVTLTGTF